MTREQRRARRDLQNPRRHTRVVESTRSARCTCDTGSCNKHGRFTPRSELTR